MEVSQAELGVSISKSELDSLTVRFGRFIGHDGGEVKFRFSSCLCLNDNFDHPILHTEAVFETPKEATEWGNRLLDLLKGLPPKSHTFSKGRAIQVDPDKQNRVIILRLP
ncbi:MAG: hypothetical protein WC668_04750 [Patescibacteria group bacterium]|jgi:hypothetical protein